MMRRVPFLAIVILSLSIRSEGGLPSLGARFVWTEQLASASASASASGSGSASASGTASGTASGDQDQPGLSNPHSVYIRVLLRTCIFIVPLNARTHALKVYVWILQPITVSSHAPRASGTDKIVAAKKGAKCTTQDDKTLSRISKSMQAVPHTRPFPWRVVALQKDARAPVHAETNVHAERNVPEVYARYQPSQSPQGPQPALPRMPLS